MIFVTDKNACASQPCQNGAQCVDALDGYQCRCSSGFTGPTCSTSKHLLTVTYSRIKCQIYTHYCEKLRNYFIMFVCCSFLSII